MTWPKPTGWLPDLTSGSSAKFQTGKGLASRAVTRLGGMKVPLMRLEVNWLWQSPPESTKNFG